MLSVHAYYVNLTVKHLTSSTLTVGGFVAMEALHNWNIVTFLSIGWLVFLLFFKAPIFAGIF